MKKHLSTNHKNNDTIRTFLSESWLDPPFHPLGILPDIDYLEELNIDSHVGPRESEISNS